MWLIKLRGIEALAWFRGKNRLKLCKYRHGRSVQVIGGLLSCCGTAKARAALHACAECRQRRTTPMDIAVAQQFLRAHQMRSSRRGGGMAACKCLQ